jgi:hypothetical protein
VPGFQPPEGEADEPDYALEQGMCLQGTRVADLSHHLMLNALK